MAQFKVLPVQAGTGENELGQVARLLEEANSQVQRVYLGLSFQIRCRERVDEGLRRSMARLERQQEDTGRLSSGLRQAMERYQACEGAVLRSYTGAAEPSGNAIPVDYGEITAWMEDVLGKLSLQASLVSASMEAFAAFLEKVDLNDTLSTAKWVSRFGTVIGVLGTFAGNLKEYGLDFSDPRLYVETAVETGVYMGLTKALTIGIGAVVAGSSAPVWVTGVAAAGILVTVNLGVEYFTGQSLTEYISDFAIDTGAVIADGISTAWESVMELF